MDRVFSVHNSCDFFLKHTILVLDVQPDETEATLTLSKNQETVSCAPPGQGHDKLSESQYYVFCW